MQARLAAAAGMKLTIIGGASTRTPLLVNGLAKSGLPIDEIALFDCDHNRLALVADVARRLCGAVRVTTADRSADAIAGADYVFICIRVGGSAVRAHDERTALAHGTLGQETVGPAGFAMAMRTVPHVVAYAREITRLAPRAWIINFTNPVGIVTQAVRTETGARMIGICDTPTELQHAACDALDLPPAETFVDYFGLNHLGWVRELYHHGAPQLHRLWSEPGRLARVYRTLLFAPDFLRDLQLLPSEYCYFYYRAADAVANIARAGQSRGEILERLNARLFDSLAQPGQDPVRVYETYLADRDAGYLQIEAGAVTPRAIPPWTAVTGYDKIAIDTVRAIHFNAGAVIPLNVENRGNLPDLALDDIVEVPCVVNANGALPLHVGPVPKAVLPLLVQVKEYERLTVRAALTRDADLAHRALACNPLVSSGGIASRLLPALMIE